MVHCNSTVPQIDALSYSLHDLYGTLLFCLSVVLRSIDYRRYLAHVPIRYYPLGCGTRAVQRDYGQLSKNSRQSCGGISSVKENADPLVLLVVFMMTNDRKEKK